MTDEHAHEESTEKTPLTPPDPSMSEMVSAALGQAARKAGIDPAEQSTTGHVVWAAMGGWRGVVESVVPSLAFILTYTITQDAWLAIGISVAIAAVFTAIRLLTKSPPAAALGGLVAALAAAALALWTGKAENNFVLGFVTNAGYGLAFLISALIGWSLIGLIGGYLMNEGTAWRRSKRKRRVYFWLAIAWAALFFARLAVQVPFYFQGDDGLATLATLKLVMGLPLFAPMLAVTWLAVRSLYPSQLGGKAKTEAGDTPSTAGPESDHAQP